jgi:hypothetical protein
MKVKVTKHILRKELSKAKMLAGNENIISAVIMDGIVHRWVGIGWVEEGPPNAKQKKDLPTVAD